jgi:hypothetical protein
VFVDCLCCHVGLSQHGYRHFSFDADWHNSTLALLSFDFGSAMINVDELGYCTVSSGVSLPIFECYQDGADSKQVTAKFLLECLIRFSAAVTSQFD